LSVNSSCKYSIAICIFSCKYRKTPVFTGKKSFIAFGSDVKSSYRMKSNNIFGYSAKAA
jgi:hypothetical protein